MDPSARPVQRVAMPTEPLIVALGQQRYRVERPWGAVPAGPGLLSDVACDAQGFVYAQRRTDPYTDADTPAVIVLAPDGRFERAWGGGVVLDGHMLTVAPDGTVYVVDRDAHEIIAFDPYGKRLGSLGRRHHPGEPFNAPSDLAVAPDGTLYVADGYGNSRVHRFSAAGAPLGGWGSPGAGPGEFSCPHAVWVRPDGTVAVTDRENHRVQLFSATGDHLFSIGDQFRAMDVHGDGGDGIYVTDQVPRLSHYDASGRLLGRCRPVLNGAHGMWRDAAGYLFLAELSPSRLTRLVPEGRLGE